MLNLNRLCFWLFPAFIFSTTGTGTDDTFSSRTARAPIARMPTTSCSASTLARVEKTIRSLQAALAAQGVDPMRALVHPGRMSHMRRTLRPCMQVAADMQQPTQRSTVHIRVVGGSMTLGNMNCMGDCAKLHLLRTTQAWPRLLKVRLVKTLPGCKLHVHSNVVPAAGISTVLHNWDSLFDNTEDIVIEDFSVNDVRGKVMVDGRANDSNAVHKHLASHEILARKVRARNASLVFMEAWAAFDRPPKCRPHTEYVHNALGEFYALPVVSFMRSVCNESATASLSSEPAMEHWRAGCGKLDLPGMQCEAHPGPHVHGIYANMLALFMLRQAAAACAPLQDESDETPQLGASYLPSSELERIAGCVAGKTSVDARLGCSSTQRFLDPANKPAGFRCYEDRPGKPGWIAEAGSTPSEMGFVATGTGLGHVVAGFLRSYTGFGRAQIAVDGHWNYSVTLDGAWDENTSQVDYMTIPWQRLLPTSAHGTLGSSKHPRRHKVALRVAAAEEGSAARGQRFKLVSLATC